MCASIRGVPACMFPDAGSSWETPSAQEVPQQCTLQIEAAVQLILRPVVCADWAGRLSDAAS